MTLTPLPILTDAEMASFEDECFRSWLNIIDARADYELRRTISLEYWRHLFDAGMAENEAIRAALGGVLVQGGIV